MEKWPCKGLTLQLLGLVFSWQRRRRSQLPNTPKLRCLEGTDTSGTSLLGSGGCLLGPSLAPVLQRSTCSQFHTGTSAVGVVDTSCACPWGGGHHPAPRMPESLSQHRDWAQLLPCCQGSDVCVTAGGSSSAVSEFGDGFASRTRLLLPAAGLFSPSSELE